MNKKTRVFSLFFTILLIFTITLLSFKNINLKAESDGLAKIVYVSSSGNASNDGTTPENAVRSIARAYELVTADGDGIIVICNNMYLDTNETLAAKKVKITSKVDNTTYPGSLTLNNSIFYSFQEDVMFDDIKMNSTSSGYGFVANGHKLHIGKNVEMDIPKDGNGNYTSDFYLIGGRSISFTDDDYVEGANIIVESGAGWTIYGAGYSNFGSYNDVLNNNGDISITVKGTAKISVLFAGFKAGGYASTENEIQADKFGNVTINVEETAYCGEIYLGSECYRAGRSEQFENTTITLNLAETTTVASLYCGGQYAYHEPSKDGIGQYQTVENIIINYNGAQIDDSIYLGGVDAVYSPNDISKLGPTEIIKNLTVNLYKDCKGPIVPGIKANIGAGLDDLGSLTTKRAQINLINDTTFEYLDLSEYEEAGYLVTNVPELRVIGYVTSGSLETSQVHKEDYNPQVIEFLSFDEEKNFNTNYTSVYTRDDDIEYAGVAVDNTTSTIVLVGGEDKPLGTNNENVIPVITATDYVENDGGKILFKFVKTDGITSWQPAVGTVVFQLPVASTESEIEEILAMFGMLDMDGYRLDYQEGTYKGEDIGQLVIAYDKADYEVKHYKENLDGTYTLVETDSLTASSGTTVTATAKEYENYSVNNDLSTLSGQVYIGEDDDDHLVLSVYYSLNTVKVLLSDNVTGEIVEKEYKVNETVTLTAADKTGYDFIGWYDKNNLVSEEKTYEFTASDGVTLTQKYEKQIYEVTATFNIGNGEVTKVTTYVEYLNYAVVVATEEQGYHFVGWYKGEDKISEELTYRFQVTESVLLVANYEKNDYTVKISCDSNCGNVSQTNSDGGYKYLDKTTVTATENYGYEFDGWYDTNDNKVSGDLTYTFTVLDNVTLVAKYNKVEYTVTPSCDSACGTVTEQKTYLYKEEATVVATVNYGYEFDGWYDINNNRVSKDLTYKFTVLNNVELIAKYNKLQYTVSTSCEEKYGVTTEEKTYYYLDKATVTVVQNVGYNFIGWYDANDVDGDPVSTDIEYTFTVKNNVTLIAKFDKNIFLVTAIVDLAGVENSKVTTYVQYNNQAVVSADEKYGYTFMGWYRETVQVSNKLVYTFNVTQSVTLVAKYEKNDYTVECEYLQEQGTITQANENGSYKYLEKVTLIVKPAYGYHFVGWFDKDGETISVNNTYIFIITENLYLNPVFEKNEYTVNVLCDGLKGNATGSGVYKYLDEVTMNVEVKDDYTFTGWYNGNEKVSDELTYLFTIENDVTLKAMFETIENSDVDQAKEDISNKAQNKIDEINANENLTEEEKAQLIDEVNKIKDNALEALENPNNSGDTTDINDSLNQIENIEEKELAKKTALNKIDEDTKALVDKINAMNDLTEEEKEAYVSEVLAAAEEAKDQINSAKNAEEATAISENHSVAQNTILDKANEKDVKKRQIFLIILAGLGVSTTSVLFLASRLRRKIM